MTDDGRAVVAAGMRTHALRTEALASARLDGGEVGTVSVPSKPINFDCYDATCPKCGEVSPLSYRLSDRDAPTCPRCGKWSNVLDWEPVEEEWRQ